MAGLTPICRPTLPIARQPLHQRECGNDSCVGAQNAWTEADWEDHLTTLFPEARVKRFIEMRGADAGSWQSLCALPAFWVGLLYDDATQKR